MSLRSLVKKRSGLKIIYKKALQLSRTFLVSLGHYWDTFTGETIVYQRFNK